jgi:hypothetical protein
MKAALFHPAQLGRRARACPEGFTDIRVFLVKASFCQTLRHFTCPFRLNQQLQQQPSLLPFPALLPATAEIQT